MEAKTRSADELLELYRRGAEESGAQEDWAGWNAAFWERHKGEYAMAKAVARQNRDSRGLFSLARFAAPFCEGEFVEIMLLPDSEIAHSDKKALAGLGISLGVDCRKLGDALAQAGHTQLLLALAESLLWRRDRKGAQYAMELAGDGAWARGYLARMAFDAELCGACLAVAAGSPGGEGELAQAVTDALLFAAKHGYEGSALLLADSGFASSNALKKALKAARKAQNVQIQEQLEARALARKESSKLGQAAQAPQARASRSKPGI